MKKMFALFLAFCMSFSFITVQANEDSNVMQIIVMQIIKEKEMALTIENYVQSHAQELLNSAIKSRSSNVDVTEIYDSQGNKGYLKTYTIDTTNVVENDTDLKFATALSVYQESSAESPDQQHGIMGIANMGYTLDGNMRLLQHAGGGYYKIDGDYRVSSQLLTFDNRDWLFGLVIVNQYTQKKHSNEMSFSHPTGFTTYTDDTMTVTNRLTVRHGTGDLMQVYTFNVVCRV